MRQQGRNSATGELISTGHQPHGDPHFQRLLDKLPAAAYTCDAEGLITFYNRHAVEVWGRAPKLNHPDDRFCGSFRLFDTDGVPIPHQECWMALAIREEREYNGQEIVIERRDGSRAHALAHANPMRDASGRLIGAVNVLVDITEQRTLQEQLREADRRKDEFLAILSHELRNPLAPIRGIVDLLVDSEHLGGGNESLLEILARQVGHLERLVDDLLEVSRINGGVLQLRRERVELASIVRTAMEFARIGESDRELVIDIGDEPVWLEADGLRLAQVLVNLLSNAVRYTPEGGRIEVRVERRRSEVVVAVCDNGVGIPRDSMARIFDPFQQKELDTRGQGEGLGLGLFIARRLSELHGGSLEAQSAGTNRGTHFFLRLPLTADASEAAPVEGAGEGAAEGTTTPVPLVPPATVQSATVQSRVFIVDDNRDAADMLAMGLESRGFSCRVEYDAAATLEAIHAEAPDALLLDIGMPGVDGIELARIVREQADDGLTLIAVTGWGDEQDRIATLEAGFDHHLVKPVDLHELAVLLGRSTNQADVRGVLP